MKLKKLFKYAMTCMLFLFAVFLIEEVRAEEYTGQAIWPSEYVSGIFIKKDRPDGYSKYQQARFIRRSEDNKFVYCLQPYVEIDNNLPYYNVIRSDYAQVLGLSEEQWQRVSLLAYYGYKYDLNGYNHNDTKWYPITAVMIWRTVAPDSDIYFTDTLNGKKVSKFESEMAEIESLIANHYKRPELQKNIVMPIGSTIEVNDSNNVLNQFKIKNTSSNIEASINGNTLSITAKATGDATITFEKTGTKYTTPPIVYVSEHSQNVFRVGNYDPVGYNYQLKIVGGRITPVKTDKETNQNVPQGDAKLGGAIYGIYKEDGTKVGTVTTKEDGKNTSDYLPSLGKFYLQEEKASEGYLLDTNKYYFEITEDNLNPEIVVYEQVIRLDFEFTKVFASSNTQELIPEQGVKFAIINSKGETIRELTTDNNGIIKFNLPYGTYTVRQLTATSGHEKLEDFTIQVKETGSVVKKVLSNAPITAKLRVVKIDSETKEVIQRANIKFKIFDVKNNEYVCQTITYPNKQTICEFETDENGEFTTAYPLMTGTYRLEEIDQAIEGYIWNTNSHEFTIDENSVLRTDSEYGIIFDTLFSNERVKGEIILEKTGEVAELTESGYVYKTGKLEGIRFGLYASEDIISNGKIIYTKDTLIYEKLTDSEGKIIFDNLYLGKYYIKEIETLNNYILDNTKYEVELKYQDQYTEVVRLPFSLINYLKKSDFELSKIDLSNGNPIKGATITISTENDEIIYIGETDEKGKIYLKELPIGKYKFVETNAPKGYLLNDEIHYFEVLENGKVIKDTLTNEKITGGFELTKTDLSTGEVIEGALIEIYTIDGKLIYSDRTNSEGKIFIEKLEYGKYYFIEKEAPEGYILNDLPHYFEITEDGIIIQDTLTNEKMEVEVPNTLNNDYMPLIMFIVSVLGLGSFAYGIKKSKKTKKK